VTPPRPNPLVHLELLTGDPAAASRFYSSLSAWKSERIETGGRSYLALRFGGEIGGGIVECAAPRPIWLPYVEVEQIAQATERARRLGAAVLLEAREGPAGWRSVVSSPDGGEVALWQPKER
jgi:predicted enzyme related to lactoylglutathione lyase